MAHGKVSHSLLAVTALLVSASAIPMMPYSMGMMGIGGMHGGLGSHIGSTYKSGSSYNGGDPGTMYPPVQSPTMLSGVSRIFNPLDNSMVSGVSVVVRPVESSSGMHGMYGGGMYGGGAGLYAGGMLGGMYGAGMYGASHGMMGALGGMYGMGHHGGQLEAIIEVLLPSDFMSASALVVFTEPAVSSTAMACPAGPILTEADTGMDYGYGYGGSSSMLHGYGMGMGYGGSEADFGVMAEVTLQADSNTFQIQGLGPFKDIKELAGRGLTICEDVQIGVDGRAACMGELFGCVKLGYTLEPESLIPPHSV